MLLFLCPNDFFYLSKMPYFQGFERILTIFPKNLTNLFCFKGNIVYLCAINKTYPLWKTKKW